ncbi:MAG: TonB-dependent receptor, partial [Candidatus Zixiibacteriota bacterium]
TNGDELVDIHSEIENFSAKEDFQYFANSTNTIKFGGQSAYYTFLPGEINATQSSINELRIKNQYALESAVYANHSYQVSPALSLDYGIRFSSFAVLGPGEVFSYDTDGVPTSSVSYGPRELIKHYGAFEPRATARYLLNEASSVKASYARNRQYLHLLSTSTTTTPFDFWHPSTKIVKPGTADQIALGYFRNLQDDAYETSVELYYKDLRDQIDYKNGADIYFNEYVESQLVFGKARAYGLEVLLRKNQGRLTGWLSYTLSKAERKFDAVNNGAWYRARQDRTHDIEIVGMYELSKRWTLGFTWVYYTGNAVTFPSGKYIVDDHVINLYTERNGYRMPAYHRLDIAFTWQSEKSSWNFSLYNAYGRRNAYAIEFRQSEEDRSQTEAVRIALFSFFPSITYSRSF